MAAGNDFAVNVREAAAADASLFALVGGATFLEAFAGFISGDAIMAHSRKNHTAEAYEALFAQPETRGWLAEVSPGAAPVGYALLTAPEFPTGLIEAGDLELRRIYLFSRFHGSGVARRLIEYAIGAARGQKARHLLLGVHPDNYRALAFYRKQGFVQVGVRHFQVGSLRFEDPVFCLTL